MKSIKEKAEEYLFSPLPQRASNYHFEAGANYVLNEVEYILKDEKLDIEETCDKLISLVEQLKK